MELRLAVSLDCYIFRIMTPKIQEYILLCVTFVTILSISACASFPFGFQGGMWDLIVLIPDHWLSIYLQAFK